MLDNAVLEGLGTKKIQNLEREFDGWQPFWRVWIQAWIQAKGVLAGPGTPRDPKSYLFFTKWVNRFGHSTEAWMRNFGPELAR